MSKRPRSSQASPTEPVPRAEHDAGYKRMFSHKEMIAPFLRKFVLRGADQDFNFSTLEPVKSDFISHELQKRDSDAVWRLRLNDSDGVGPWTYVYIQLEFQSRPERFMAVRVLNYLCMLYEHLAHHGEVTDDGRLPPVLPIVLYNGRHPWKKPVSIRELIAPAPEALKPYLPSFKFLLVDEGQWPREDLDPSDNPASALFSLEQARQNEDVLTGVRNLYQSTRGSSLEPLRSDMVKWLLRSLLPLRFPDQNPSDLLENQNMLAETVKEWTTQWLAEGREQGLIEGLEKGREQGREQGIIQGREQGLRETLDRLLRVKFGETVSNDVSHRLDSADEATLSTWNGL